MLIESAVLVPGALAARYGVALERLVLDQLRRDQAQLPEDLGELLGELVTAGRRWRETYQPAAEHVGTCGIPATPGDVILMNTEDVAARLGITSRAVRARAARGSVPARRGRHGWVFDPIDIEDLINQRRIA